MKDLSSQPIQLSQRTVIVDVLRGWALFGVVLMNYYDFFTLGRNWDTFKPDQLTNIVMYTLGFVFAAKSWTMLSMLFGYGFAVLMNNVSNKGHNPYGFFAGRMFWLLVLALINSAIFFGDILKDYALLGLLLLLFYRSSAKTSFVASIVLLLAIPALNSFIYSLGDGGWKHLTAILPLYQSQNLLDVLNFGLKGTYLAQMISKPYLYTVHVVMFCCFLWGFSLYRINFFDQLAAKVRYIKRTFWISLGAALLFMGTLVVDKHFKWNFLTSHYNLTYWVVLSTMLFITSAICWLYVAGRCKRFFASLAVMGKMTLTNYMVQNLIGMLVFSGFGFGIFNSKPIWFYLLLAVVVYTLQVYLSHWWLSRYNYGPIEWIWRQLSYRKRLPLKK